jgi:hypothetical protein
MEHFIGFMKFMFVRHAFVNNEDRKMLWWKYSWQFSLMCYGTKETLIMANVNSTIVHYFLEFCQSKGFSSVSSPPYTPHPPTPFPLWGYFLLSTEEMLSGKLLTPCLTDSCILHNPFKS